MMDRILQDKKQLGTTPIRNNPVNPVQKICIISEVVIQNPFDYPYLFHLEKYPSSIAPGFKRGISKGALSGL